MDLKVIAASYQFKSGKVTFSNGRCVGTLGTSRGQIFIILVCSITSILVCSIIWLFQYCFCNWEHSSHSLTWSLVHVLSQKSRYLQEAFWFCFYSMTLNIGQKWSVPAHWDFSQLTEPTSKAVRKCQHGHYFLISIVSCRKWGVKQLNRYRNVAHVSTPGLASWILNCDWSTGLHRGAAGGMFCTPLKPGILWEQETLRVALRKKGVEPAGMGSVLGGEEAH